MPFATTDDVATRLGRSLTASEEEFSQYVIDTITGLVVDCVDRDAAWAAALTPVPPFLKALCVEKAIAAGSNPQGLRSETKQIGNQSRSRSFNGNGGSDIFLTPAEERMVSRAVYGTTTGSASVEAVPDRLIDLREGRDPDVDP